jgi:hypothetical protein
VSTGSDVRRNPWFRFGINAWSLGMGASSVILFAR